MDNNITLTVDLDAKVFAGLASDDNDAWTDSNHELGRMLRDLAEMIEAGGVPNEPIGLLDFDGNTIAVLRENSVQAQSHYRKVMASCITHGSVMPCNCFAQPVQPTVGFRTELDAKVSGFDAMLDTLTDAYLQP